MKNIDIIELNKKIKTHLGQPSNKDILKKLQPISKENKILTRSTLTQPKPFSKDDPDPINNQAKSGFSGIAETRKGDLNYKMMATKGHVEMTSKQYMPDPFKKHLINFETHREQSRTTLDNKK